MRLKEGDKVRSRRDCPAGWYKVGDIFTITAVDGDFIEFVDNHGSGRLRPNDEFELLPVSGATGKPAFKVGDRVRVITKTGVNMPDTGVVGVICNCDNGYTVAVEGVGAFGYDAHDLELVPIFLEHGRYYRSRNGRKIGPVYVVNSQTGGCIADDGVECHPYRRDGTIMYGDSEHLDLIAEWIEEPASNDNQSVAEQWEEAVFLDASKAGPSQLHLAKGRLVKINQGYGFELARYGDYVWVDTGKKQPVVAHINEIKEAA